MTWCCDVGAHMKKHVKLEIYKRPKEQAYGKPTMEWVVFDDNQKA